MSETVLRLTADTYRRFRSVPVKPREARQCFGSGLHPLEGKTLFGHPVEIVDEGEVEDATPSSRNQPDLGPDFGIAQLMRDAHETAVEKGWWEEGEDENPRNFPEQIALMHSELSEVLEEFRQHGLDPARFSYAYESYRIAGKQIDKPEGIAVEFADLLIRVADTCQRYKIPLVEALRKKMEFNRHRPHRHGGKKA